MLVWLAFGAVAVVPAMNAVTWEMALYAVLSLTAVRMAPVAVALAGARLGWATVLLVAWFGPRGMPMRDIPDRRLTRRSSPPRG